MSDEQVLHQSPMMYRLLRERGGALVIEVVVGSFALSEVRVRLEPDEVAAWEREGSEFSDRLAKQIAANPKFDGRQRPGPSALRPPRRAQLTITRRTPLASSSAGSRSR